MNSDTRIFSKVLSSRLIHDNNKAKTPTLKTNTSIDLEIES